MGMSGEQPAVASWILDSILPLAVAIVLDKSESIGQPLNGRRQVG